MAASDQKLASSLDLLRAVRSPFPKVLRVSTHPELTRVHLKRLIDAGFLKPIITGWYRFASPSEREGDTTSWIASADAFAAAYATHRFEDAWQMGPEQSLALQTGGTSVFRQAVVQAPAANNQVLPLPNGMSLFMYRITREQLDPRSRAHSSGLRLQSVEFALAKASPTYFHQQPQSAQIALRQADAGEMLRLVLDAGATTVAGRFIGGLIAVGRNDEADRLRRAMVAAGHDVRSVDPFKAPLPDLGGARTESPHAQRIRAMWAAMRPVVVAVFEKVEAGASHESHELMRDVQERYVADAYNSLSIEGYDVDEALIERVRSGGWAPDLSADDKKSRDALAAKGYAEAFGQVLEAVGKTVEGRIEAATVLERLLPDWHLALFSSSVRAGIIKASDLAGFRNKAVFISNAQHVPPPHEALRDCMPALMELLRAEEHGAVRAVLGHFVFVFIHPYIDGNGRLGRFIMNFMLTTAGYVWTIVPVARRTEYMDVLAAASTGQDIRPFARFIASLVTQQTRRPMTRAR